MLTKKCFFHSKTYKKNTNWKKFSKFRNCKHLKNFFNIHL